MSRNIPGINEVEGREYFYIEILSEEGFDDILNEALTCSPDVPLPKSGGVIEEKARIILNCGTQLLGVSYRGDLAGWQSKLQAFCKAKHREWGIVSCQQLVLSDGSELELANCKVVFDR